LEDIYFPFRQKRRTRAMVALEHGLGPLADLLWKQDPTLDVDLTASRYVDVDRGVPDIKAALAGGRDIIAEWISDDEWARTCVRFIFERGAVIKSRATKGKETEGAKYRDYFDYGQKASSAPSHRVLAVFRGEREGFLTVRVAPADEDVLLKLSQHFVGADPISARHVAMAVTDGYKRLLKPSMEAELRKALKAKADSTAIGVFAENLRNLLLAPPLGQKAVLAIDPGFRTGCKIACLDRQGALVHSDTVYFHLGDERENKEALRLAAMVSRYQIEAIAIGNGTAGRETEVVVRKLGLPPSIPVIMVNESGASVYSASETARQEFPDHDLTVRGTVSIGRRLMDPLAELVKIDPQAIGVGQYQHDLDQSALSDRLNDVVESCVDSVGVDVNTASPGLLSRVSGIGPSLADAIVRYRQKTGSFQSRMDMLQVPGLGPKAFELAAGFLRIVSGANPLDGSGIHPESYTLVAMMARDLGGEVRDLLIDPDARKRIRLTNYVSDSIGLPTLTDIMEELAKPGRDPRDPFEIFSFSDSIHTIGDLRPNMELSGIITNVAAFGAFVDLGVHVDGLIHISRLADRFVSDPHQVVSVGQRVNVTVMEVDFERKRISLSMNGQ